MFSLKHLTKKFNRQTLSEVKPAPLSETVDNTLPSTKLLHTSPPLLPASDCSPAPSPSSFSTPLTDVSPLPPPKDHSTTDNPSTATINTDNPSVSSNFPLSSPTITFSPTSLSPSSSPLSSSDSEDEDDEKIEPSAPSLGVRAHSPTEKSLSTARLKIERISSAEKRKYSQFKCSTGSSSPSSSDDEIKEAFEVHPHEHRNPSLPNPHLWGWGKPSGPSCTTSTSGCSFTFEPTSRPVPVSHHKHKFFAQMSTNFSERPYLDFNKMQHSKRLVMVRRPMVIRNNSKVHSIQRPPPLNLQVSLDISQHSFQPVLT